MARGSGEASSNSYQIISSTQLNKRGCLQVNPMTRQYQLRCIQIHTFIAIHTHPNISAFHSTTHKYLKFWRENQGEEVSTSASVRNIRMLDRAEVTIQWAGLLHICFRPAAMHKLRDQCGQQKPCLWP